MFRPFDLTPTLAAQQALVGALVRGSLTPLDLEDLGAGWWTIDSASLWQRAMGELHGGMVDACEASIEIYGRVHMQKTLVALRALGMSAGQVWQGKALGYLPRLARQAPRRAAALRALGTVVYAAQRRLEARARAASAMAAIADGLARLGSGDRLAVAASGMSEGLRRWAAEPEARAQHHLTSRMFVEATR